MDASESGGSFASVMSYTDVLNSMQWGFWEGRSWPGVVNHMRTLLFDIDGTLLTTHGGGKEAIRRALMEEFSVGEPSVDLSFGGRTDRGLFAEILERNGIDVSDRSRQRLRRAYTRLFPALLVEMGGTVFAGVPELLQQLDRSDSCRIAVMTGNLPETATRKLEHFGLRQHVEWIVGGDLDEQRNHLAARAMAHLRRRHGLDAAEDVVVIGDTVADIQCGRSIGAQVVAVCTGGTSREDLQAAGPDAIWEDFSDWYRVAESLLEGEPGF